MKKNALKNSKKALLAMILGVATISTASAQTVFTWTNGGVANDIDDPDNWDQATAPASGSKLGTTNAADIIRFDSESATLPTANFDLVRIGAGNAISNVEVLNGIVNFNRAEVWHLGNSTFTIGDGDLTNSAQANFAGSTSELNRDGGAITYVINADGTLKLNNNFQYGQSNTRIRLLGGAVDGSGRTVTAEFTNDNTNYVIFEDFSSTFTLNYGGQLGNATAVTDEFGDSFRLGGSLTSIPSAALAIIADNGSTFTVGVVPEPSNFALLAGCLSLTWVMLRRRA